MSAGHSAERDFGRGGARQGVWGVAEISVVFFGAVAKQIGRW